MKNSTTKTYTPERVIELIRTMLRDHEITGFKIIGEHRCGNTVVGGGSLRKLSREAAAGLKIKRTAAAKKGKA